MEKGRHGKIPLLMVIISPRAAFQAEPCRTGEVRGERIQRETVGQSVLRATPSLSLTQINVRMPRNPAELLCSHHAVTMQQPKLTHLHHLSACGMLGQEGMRCVS